MIATGHNERAAAIAERIKRGRDVHHEHTKEVIKEERLPPNVIEAIETLQAACIELQNRVAFIEENAITDVRIIKVDTD